MTDDAEYWRRQAKEIRAIAERMKDPDEQAMMFAMAADYDKRAQAAEGEKLREIGQPMPRPDR
jgi:hypothetical protein